MQLPDVILSLGGAEALNRAQIIARQNNIVWDAGICYVFQAVARDSDRAPKIGGNRDDENTVILKWLRKYVAGKEGRSSLRVSNPPGTVADPIIEEIIGTRLPRLSRNELNMITHAHRLSMSAENILGLILEEYLSVNLTSYGWHCAWGETVKSVDFVHESGRLLQIKNRSNSENSSSSAVRSGTEIQKWYRIKADRVEYMWDELNQICGTTALSEVNFIAFVRQVIGSNPRCLAVETNNPMGLNS